MNTRPLPESCEENALWTADDNGQIRLRASCERKTGQCFFPPIPATSPIAARFETVALSPFASLYSFTVIHPNPKTGQKPFALIYADFPEQVRVFGRLKLDEGHCPQIGWDLRIAIESAGDGSQTYSFVRNN